MDSTNRVAPSKVATDQNMTFADIAKWASCDTTLLRRELLTAVRKVLGEATVKLKVAGVFLARAQLGRLRELSDLLDGDGGLTKMVFDPNRLRHMNSRDLTRLWAAAEKLRRETEDAFVKNALNPERMEPDPDEIKTALSVDDRLKEETRELEERGARKAMVDVMTEITEKALLRANKIVSDPPVVC